MRRNLKHIETLVKNSSLEKLSKKEYQDLLVIHELFKQQEQMYKSNSHTVKGRIVSISQPYVRPIVRGKAGSPVEFGAKLTISVVDGYVFREKVSWENYNEGIDLIEHVEAYKKRFGYYPESVHADKIYQNRNNRQYCKENDIRLSGLEDRQKKKKKRKLIKSSKDKMR